MVEINEKVARSGHTNDGGTIKIRPLLEEELRAVAAMAAERFLDDPLFCVQLAGVEARKELLTVWLMSELEMYRQKGDVWVLANGRGLLAGHESRHQKSSPYFRLARLIKKRSQGVIGKEDWRRIMANSKPLWRLTRVRWRKQAAKGDYFYVDLVVVAKEMKGSGAFRSLLEPFLAKADQAGMPVLLDTNNFANLPIYHHFGFQLVREYAAPQVAVKQYCLMRHPAGDRFPQSD